MVTRRNFLRTAAGLLVAAPFVARAGVIMPVRRPLAAVQGESTTLTPPTPSHIIQSWKRHYPEPAWERPMFNSQETPDLVINTGAAGMFLVPGEIMRVIQPTIKEGQLMQRIIMARVIEQRFGMIRARIEPEEN